MGIKFFPISPLLWVYLFFCPLVLAQVTVSISSSFEPNQAEDMRMGMFMGANRVRYAGNLTSNLLGPAEFENFSNGRGLGWEVFDFDGAWTESAPSGVLFSSDSTPGNVAHGLFSQKIVLPAGSLPMSFGQYQSYREFQPNVPYVFSCYLKQNAMSTPVRLRIRYICPPSNTLIDAYQDFQVGETWANYSFSFSFPQACAPRDPIQGSASSTRIDILGQGTLWIDSCSLIDTNDHTDWGLSLRAIETLRALNPATIRYGGLGANPVSKENILVSHVSDAVCYSAFPNNPSAETSISFNQFLKLNQAVHSNPQYVLSQRFSLSDFGSFLDYVFGSPSTQYGAKRIQNGYSSWANKFEKFYFELGNELLCCPAGACQALAPGLPLCDWTGNVIAPAYADWSTERIQLFRSSPYYDPASWRVGFNTWSPSQPALSRQTLIEEKANAGGGNADFLITQGYFPGSSTKYWDSAGNESTINDLYSNSTAYYRRVMGQASLAQPYVAYHTNLSQSNYMKILPYGFYEYGVGGTRNQGSQWNVETSLGTAVSLLDFSVAMRKYGAELMGYFGFYGLGWTWGLVDQYPFLKKRPAYYLFSMYGTYVRGQLLSYSLPSNAPSFDPWGPTANQHEFIEGQAYPVQVPLVGVYPFKQNNRYSILLINRSTTDAVPVFLSLPYAPSSQAKLYFVTGSSISANNETTSQIGLQSQTISNFSNNYLLNLAPYSAYVLVNYAEGSSVCLDNDGDGFGANPDETIQCPMPNVVDCDDSNPRIKPGNSNVFCDCDRSNNNYSIGGLETVDGADNDCDGVIDDLTGQAVTLVCGNGPILSPCLCGGQSRTNGFCCNNMHQTGVACTSSQQCPQGQQCINPNSCQAECRVPGTCSTNADCSSANQICCSSICTTLQCSTNGQCSDTNALTNDICSNPGTCSATCIHPPVGACTSDANCASPAKCCNGLCNSPICLADAACNDANDSTIDSCQNPGACLSVCVHSPVCPNPSYACLINADCDDGDNCTTDSCDTRVPCISQCTHAPIVGCIPLEPPKPSLKLTMPSNVHANEVFQLHVMDANFFPVQGANVVYGDTNQTTNSDGNVLLTSRMGVYRITVSKTGFANASLFFFPSSQTNPLAPGKINGTNKPSLVIEIVSITFDRVSLRITDKNNNPVGDANVIYENQLYPSDADGLVDFNLGKSRMVQASATGFATVSKFLTVVAPPPVGHLPDQPPSEPNRFFGIRVEYGAAGILLLLIGIFLFIRFRDKRSD